MNNKEAGPIGVVIVAADPYVRAQITQALRAASRMRVLGAHASVKEAGTPASRPRPDVAVLALSPPGDSDGRCLGALRALLPETPILAVASKVGREGVRSVLAAGAGGYFSSEGGLDGLVEAVREVQAGRMFLCPRAAAHVGDFARAVPAEMPAIGALTDRQKEVLACAARGLADKEIADHLKISAATARTHMERIRERLGVPTRTAAVALWLAATAGRPSA